MSTKELVTRHDYQKNYDEICADHLAEYETTGQNPYMTEDELLAAESETITLLRDHTRPGGTILDAGVGMGRILAKFPELDCHGVDIATGYLPYAAAAGIDAIQADIENLPYPDERFDYVLCTDVLEHVLDLNACLRELERVLKKDGLLFLRVPDREELEHYLRSEYEFVHLRSFHEEELQLLMTRVFRFTIVETKVGAELSLVARK